MALNLNQTLSWSKSLAASNPAAAAELAMLNDLQGNILKGHGRPHTSNIFVSFKANQAAAAIAFIHSVGADVTTALDQLTSAQVFKATGKGGGEFIAFFLSARGYDALGLVQVRPQSAAFVAGMKQRPLADPAPEGWSLPFRDEIHAMLLIADESPAGRDALQAQYQARIGQTSGAVRILGIVQGDALINSDKNGIEHFGYVDGRSQPLTLQEDVDHDARHGGIDQWDPAIHLSQVLVKCPGGLLEVSHGSFFVFRQLEQNVRGFKETEEKLGVAQGGIGELAGATVVGRFENGTPVATAAADATVANGVPNNFNFDSDPAGLKCPLAGHIRKTNQRTPASKSHLMARRGIPFGARSDGPNDGKTENKPSGGVGLLFMAYQSSIENQFEVTQRIWANSEFFPPGPGRVGIDPVIGQVPAGNAASPQQFPDVWGVSLGKPTLFSGFVKMLGGEYFFAPSISFLKGSI